LLATAFPGEKIRNKTYLFLKMANLAKARDAKLWVFHCGDDCQAAKQNETLSSLVVAMSKDDGGFFVPVGRALSEIWMGGVGK